MARMTKETLAGIISQAYGLEISPERLESLARTVSLTLEALERSSQVDLEGLEPGSTISSTDSSSSDS